MACSTVRRVLWSNLLENYVIPIARGQTLGPRPELQSSPLKPMVAVPISIRRHPKVIVTITVRGRYHHHPRSMTTENRTFDRGKSFGSNVFNGFHQDGGVKAAKVKGGIQERSLDQADFASLRSNAGQSPAERMKGPAGYIDAYQAVESGGLSQPDQQGPVSASKVQYRSCAACNKNLMDDVQPLLMKG